MSDDCDNICRQCGYELSAAQAALHHFRKYHAAEADAFTGMGDVYLGTACVACEFSRSQQRAVDEALAASEERLKKAVAEERERCAQVVEKFRHYCDGIEDHIKSMLVRAIRSGPREETQR